MFSNYKPTSCRHNLPQNRIQNAFIDAKWAQIDCFPSVDSELVPSCPLMITSRNSIILH